MLQVAAGAAQVYVQELSRIKRLSEAGSAQLAADLDYFCNVLAALGVALPPQLVTWQVRPLPSRSLPLCICCMHCRHHFPSALQILTRRIQREFLVHLSDVKASRDT